MVSARNLVSMGNHMAQLRQTEKKAPSPHLVTDRIPPGGPMPPYNVYSEACPTRLVLDRLADKWVVLILWLLQQEPRRFNALRREIEGLSQKVLSQVLKRLERDGLVARQAFPTVPVTVEYSITPLGRTLAETVASLTNWAHTHIETVLEAQRAYDAQTGAQTGAQTSRATT
jgi:DNA-binding HxlR family transcriptional regulator